jgi:hypothetical protein
LLICYNDRALLWKTGALIIDPGLTIKGRRKTEEANLFLLHGQQGAGRWGFESVKKKDLLGLPIRVIL